MQDYTNEPKYREWLARVAGSGCALNAVTPLNLLRKSNGELLFGLFDVDADTPEGGKLPRYVMVRGNACVIVPQIVNRDTGERKFLMVLQRRTGNGAMNLEFPAGMLDRNTTDPITVAGHEVFEETGVTVSRQSLYPLHDRPLYTSIGLQDEAIYFYGCRIDMTEEEFTRLEGRVAGAAGENERCVVTLKTREELLREAVSCQVVLGLTLFLRHGFGDASAPFVQI